MTPLFGLSDNAICYIATAAGFIGFFFAVAAGFIVACWVERPQPKPPCVAETEVDGCRVRHEAPTPEELARVRAEPRPKVAAKPKT